MDITKVLSWHSSGNSFEQLQESTKHPVDVEVASTVDSLASTENLEEEYVEPTLQRKCMAEFFATFILVGFGAGSVSQTVLSENELGNYTHITMCWGIAVMLAINIAGSTSGAHLNPAFTIVFCIYNHQFPWRAVPWYCLSQTVGAFFGFAAVYCMYFRAFMVYDPQCTIERGGRIFASFPQINETQFSAFVAEVLCSAFFMVGAFALGDPRNPHMIKPLVPVLTGALVVAVGMAFGLTTGYALNPAVDFAGRVFSSMAGWGSTMFTAYNNYWWVPVVAPVLGGWLGAGSYIIFIGNQPTRFKN
ncbi:aquaporin [Thraustotheca clavata]|uniref:Aquaporin n=1 Tax=Thraustotheca clavata TaxID=74557 RepID=A0A1V9Z584_9STRA|nr:aquaporin [Thraustotheca clavata]